MKYLPYALSREELIAFTPLWEGERFEDGRPKVGDDVLDRIRDYVSVTFAWGILNGKGYKWQYLGGFRSTLPEEALVGRALTALYAPCRPDLKEVIYGGGHKSGRIGDAISWPIDELAGRDVYVAEVFGKIEDGAVVGERLSTAVFANSKNGSIHNASVRDIDGILGIDGFNIFHRGMHPSYASPTIMLMGINCPTRMEGVTVMPGDVALAKGDCAIFIPPHLAEFIALSGAIENYRDRFGMLRLRERTYTPGQIDANWGEGIECDFARWLEGQEGAPFTLEDMERVKGIRTW